MKMRKLLLGCAATGALIASPAVFAAAKLMDTCKSDLKKFSCAAKTDQEAHACLEKNEKAGQKNEGFTVACYKAHVAYEKQSGKEEKGDAEHNEAGKTK